MYIFYKIFLQWIYWTLFFYRTLFYDFHHWTTRESIRILDFVFNLGLIDSGARFAHMTVTIGNCCSYLHKESWDRAQRLAFWAVWVGGCLLCQSIPGTLRYRRPYLMFLFLLWLGYVHGQPVGDERELSFSKFFSKLDLPLFRGPFLSILLQNKARGVSGFLTQHKSTTHHTIVFHHCDYVLGAKYYVILSNLRLQK
jgi:hypothetical protein